MSQLITKIKLKAQGRTEITLTEEIVTDQSKTVTDSHIGSDELRHADFTAAGDAIAPLCRQVFNIPKEWEIEFKSVHLDRDDGFAVIIGLYFRFGKDFSSGAGITMPKLTQDPINEVSKLPVQLYDAIIKLIEEADQFAFHDKRAQSSLPLTDEELDEAERRNITPMEAYVSKAGGARRKKGQ